MSARSLTPSILNFLPTKNLQIEGIMNFLGTYNEQQALTTFPVFVAQSSDTRLKNVNNFGSGFLLRYKGQIFFVTADHVIHYADHQIQMRSQTAFTPWIYTSYHDVRLFPLFIPVPLATSLSSANLPDICQKYPHRLGDAIEQIANPSEDAFEDEELSEVMIPNMHDIAFAEVNPEAPAIIYSSFFPFIPYPLLKIPLRLERIHIIDETEIGEIDQTSICHTGGFTDNRLDIKKGRYHSVFRFLSNLTFESRQHQDAINPDEHICLKCPEVFTEKELVGISGSPVFNQDNKLCGVTIRTLHTSSSIIVFPIQSLLKYLDYEIRIQQISAYTASKSLE